MSTKKEEERNEKIIRGLLKLPPNRRCINCNSMGPQYVCTNFWTFVCVTCSGIHREFTHRVKSVSMAKFTSQEVDALQKGGNQRAKEIYLRDCDPMQIKLPDSSADKIREFIRSVYVDKKYSGGKAFEKPPRDMQNHKKQTEDHRRASSYHSYSQSPPYDYQYEERIYGKQPAMLTRKPGSDRGHYEGKLASFLSSSLSQPEQTYDERFGNESCGSRVSDFSASSPGDLFRLENQSPNFQDLHSKSNPNVALHTKRTASSSSIGSFDSSSLKSADSGVSSDTTPDLIDESTLQKAATVAPDPPIDLFAHVNLQPSSENTGWATFDSSPVKSVPHTNGLNSSHNVPSSNGTHAPLEDLFSGDFNGTKLSSEMNSNNAQAWNAFEDTSPSIALENTFSGFGKFERPYSTTSNSQSWLSFDDNNGNANSAEPSAVAQEPQTSNNPFAIDDTPEVLPTKGWVQNLSTEEIPNLTNPFEEVAELFPSAVVPLAGGNLEENMSTNPFDLPIDTHSGDFNMFMDMGSLQEALPDPQVPDAFIEAFSDYPTSSAQGAMMCLASQASSSPFQNIAPPTVVASASRNPFA